MLLKAPEVLAANEDPRTSTDDPKWMLVEYVGNGNRAPGAHAALRALAEQQDEAGGYAIEKMLYLGNPSDIPFLHDRLIGELPAWFGSIDFPHDFEALRKRFGPAATSLLASLTHASTGSVAAAASLELDREGNRVGTSAMLDAFRTNREDEETEILNQTIGTPVCPGDGDNCHTEVSRPAQFREPWAQARKAAAVKYFEARLAGEH